MGGGSGYSGALSACDLKGNESVVTDFTNWTPGNVTPCVLVQATNGAHYGALSSFGAGPSVVYRLVPGGQPVAVHSFTADEGELVGPPMQARDGNLYGLSSIGVYRLTLSGDLTTIHTFSGDDGTTPIGNLASGQ